MQTLLFDDALRGLRVAGSVLLHDTYPAPWGIEIPDEAVLRQLLNQTAATRVLPFHLVREGSFVLRQQGCADMQVLAGEVVICPGGQSHVMALGAAWPATPFADILNGNGQAMQRNAAAETNATSLLCGVFLLKAAPLNPLLAALPPTLKIATSGADISPALRLATEMLRLEVGRGNRNGFSTCRLLELFCAEAFLAFSRQQGRKSASWFKALDDAKLGPALVEIHRHPQAKLTVAGLAALCAMSPSRFAARFRAAMGCSVMAYATRWRMNLACVLLQESLKNLAEIAGEVGYEDVAAFSRAFKLLVGQSPAHWRKAANNPAQVAFDRAGPLD